MADGCETSIAGDPANCGGCGRVCSDNHVPAPACTDGVCGGACATGYADCNADKQADGCETATTSDVLNCGECGVVCSGKIGRGCQGGTCNATCDDGIRNQGESDVDCGGPCGPCGIGGGCGSDGDCRSGVCTKSACAAVTCPHGVGLPGPPATATGAGTYSFAVGDLDGDGVLDVAVADPEESDIRVAFGTGDGAFAASKTYAIGSSTNATQTSSVVIGDVDGDGALDIVAANSGATYVSVYFNQGSGQFGPRVDVATGAPGPQFVALGDIDRDGKPDLVFDDRVSINEGARQFAVPTPYTDLSFGAVSLGDMNGDGVVDVVGTTNYSYALHVLINDGSGNFTEAPNSINAAVELPVLGDFNGDGALDVALLNSAGDTNSLVLVYLNTGGGVLSSVAQYEVDKSAAGLAAGDFDADGRADLAVTSSYDDTLGILLSHPDGTFAPVVDYLTGYTPVPVASGDFNGDGKLDGAVGDQASADTQVYLNRGGALFETVTDVPTGTSASGIAVGDLDRDGILDLVVTNSTGFNNSSNTVSVLMGEGGRRFRSAVSYQTGNEPSSVALADLDGDGFLDVVVGQHADGTVGVFRNDGTGALGARVDYAAGNYCDSVVTADFDGDGRADVAANNSGGIALLLGRGDGTLVRGPDILTEEISGQAGPQTLAVGDLNGDGRPDFARLQLIAGFGGDNPVVAFIYNAGGGQFTVGSPLYTTTFTTMLLVADLSGRGSVGLAVANQNSTVTVGGVDYPTPSLVAGLAAGDVDGDGIPDLIVAGGNAISVFPATSPGVYGARRDYLPSGGPVAAVDLDGDGRVDLVTGSATGVAVVPNLCMP
jgi:hypothetical protein